MAINENTFNTYSCPIQIDVSTIVDIIYNYINSNYPDIFDTKYPENLKQYLQDYIYSHEDLDQSTVDQINSFINQIDKFLDRRENIEPFVSILKALREVLLKSIIEAVVKPLLDKSWEQINSALNNIFCYGAGGGGGAGSASLAIYRETYIPDSPITAGTEVEIPNGRSYTVGGNNLMVYVNGILQTKEEEYVEYTSTKIKFQYDLPASSVIDFIIISTETNSDTGESSSSNILSER